jgi:hypothetical protein
MPLPQMRFLVRFFFYGPCSNRLSALEPRLRQLRDCRHADHESTKDGGGDPRLAGLATLEQAVQRAARRDYAEKQHSRF